MICKKCATELEILAVKVPSSVDALNKLLADLMVLFIKLNNYHWNMVGDSFLEVHQFFQTQYEKIGEFIDTVAERIRALDGNAIGTMQEFISTSSLKEGDNRLSIREMMREVQNDHKTISKEISHMFKMLSNINDDGSADIILGMQAEIDKFAWMLSSFLRG